MDDNYVAWCRYRTGTIYLCDSDADGAFKVFRHPYNLPEEIKILVAENARLKTQSESLARSVMADMGNHREPLTSKQINSLVNEVFKTCGDMQPNPEIIVRAIERAHGIGTGL